ncbi:hypothetical protein HBH53_049120 [Parastagonospora nodorum]|nr:hypothetical protein HBH53_049120 [Parastagonospora nodorum]KAH4125179.1 hypothetical protein HBH47_059330 [Parastagonospora nodorum]KAH4195583.1 hypothetical protein HBH42_074050 [Parastagonospora nodorum]KAH5011385.1 hypothetical protein HBI74_193250 [Parastagonospora nodorum]KAH5157913.1 hypothetical protein HBH69_075280 [Parastagonospora nodorum]
MPSTLLPAATTQAERLQVFDQLTIYIGAPHYVLLCRACKTAVPLTTFKYHFCRTSLHTYRVKDIKALVQAWKEGRQHTHPLRLASHADAQNWARPTAPVPPIAALPILHGFACHLPDHATGRPCNIIVRHLSAIQIHCKHVHGWENPSSRGRPRPLPDGPEHPAWEANVPCQRLGLNNKLGMPWRVIMPSPPPAPLAAAQDPQPKSAWEALEDQLADAPAEPAAAPGLDSLRFPAHPSAWLEKTNWLTHLQGQHLPSLAALLTHPVPEETGLVLLLEAFDCVINEARTSIHVEEINVFGLHRVNSYFRGRSFRRPLHYKLLHRTYIKYAQVWHRLLTFVYRLAVNQEGPAGFSWSLTPSQQQALSELQALLPAPPTHPPPPTPPLTEEQDNDSLAGALRRSPSPANSTTSTLFSYYSVEAPPPGYPTTPIPPSSPWWPLDLPAADSQRPLPPPSPLWLPEIAEIAEPGYLHSSNTPPPTSPVAPRSTPKRYRLRRPQAPSSIVHQDSDSDEDSKASRYSPSPSPSLRSPSPAPLLSPAPPPAQAPAPLPAHAPAPALAPNSQQRHKPGPALIAACMRFCIALLDHKIKGKLSSSIVISFLSVLGINTARNGFEDAVSYTSKLSGLVKLAQLVVVRQALADFESGQADSPNDAVGALQDRFMAYGTESPLEWVLHLRAYGTRIRDSTTTIGHIGWSDDRQQLSYKSLELSMNGLRWFVKDQVQLATAQLADLLLLPEDPTARTQQRFLLDPAHLKDDPSNSSAGFSFLQDPRNSTVLAGRERHLLNKLKAPGELHDRFFGGSKDLTWDKTAVHSYIKQTHRFLRRLLLLIHLTGGQPARGTELLTLRWRNSASSEVRNIFIEHGLVAFVTSYHKNYSQTSVTKTIFRYLPSEIGTLLVLYLSLVTPFLEQLHKLCPLPSLDNLGSLLWTTSINPSRRANNLPRADTDKTPLQESPWLPTTLGQIISKEFQKHLNTSASILTWRHSAIAISREHLPPGCKFKRDYGPESGSSAMDLQAAHTSRAAGINYARDKTESPFSTSTLRSEFRKLSQVWHTCLGFGTTLPPRDGAEAPDAATRALHPERDGESPLADWEF